MIEIESEWTLRDVTHKYLNLCLCIVLHAYGDVIRFSQGTM